MRLALFDWKMIARIWYDIAHLSGMGEMSTIILGIETSCDETAIAVVADGRRIHSNVVASQIPLHAPYGGIVPEVASREHLTKIVSITEQSIDKAGLAIKDLDAIAVTNGPGLVGALMVGVNFSKALGFVWGLPALGINHLEGHIYSAWLMEENPAEKPGFPLLCLIASGGHTDLVLMEDHGNYVVLGRTRDDAAGEAFDKAARILGLGFPGGPEIQRMAELATGTEILPRAWMKGTHEFSFSGVKTALLNLARKRGLSADIVPDLACAFQEAVVDVLVTKTLDAALLYGVRGIVLGGGVIANKRLRQRIREMAPVPVLIPPPFLCTDNGAMIAACAYFRIWRGDTSDFALDVNSSAQLGKDS